MHYDESKIKQEGIKKDKKIDVNKDNNEAKKKKVMSCHSKLLVKKKMGIQRLRIDRWTDSLSRQDKIFI